MTYYRKWPKIIGFFLPNHSLHQPVPFTLTNPFPQHPPPVKYQVLGSIQELLNCRTFFKKRRGRWVDLWKENEEMEEYILRQTINQPIKDKKYKSNKWFLYIMNEGQSEWMDDSMNEWMSGWEHEWMSERRNGWMSDGVEGGRKEWKNEWTNEWKIKGEDESRNEWIKEGMLSDD